VKKPRDTTLPVPPVTAQFAALEPIWAGISSSAQLRALLTLGALFNKRVHVHDTQLIDNPRVIGDFSQRHESDHNLYNLLTELIKAQIVVVGLREFNYLYREDRQDPCASLVDVVRSWERNSPDGAGWVTSPLSETRRRMLGHLDSTLAQRDGGMVPYDYMLVKHEFMRQVREESNRPDSALEGLLRDLPVELRRDYAKVVDQPWFSHTPLYGLLREAGLPMSHDLIQIHGIFDETAYARAYNARLLGSDWQSSEGALAERVLDPERESGTRGSVIPSEAELAEAAYRLVEGPPPELLAGLRIDEILALREHAAELFEIQAHFEVDNLTNVDDTLAHALADAAADYWEVVCAHVRKTRPHLALRPTKMGIFLRRHLPTVSRLAERFATSGLATATDVLLKVIPGVNSVMSEESRQSLVKHVNLEFVFFVEADRMRRLRQLYPHRGWIAADTRVSRQG
jgi:hypothetical protein